MKIELEFSEDDQKSIDEFTAAHYGGSVAEWVRDLVISQTNPQSFQRKMMMIYAKAEERANKGEKK